MRYSMCFFPFVGIFVALFQWLWATVCGVLSFSDLLLGVGMAAVPIAVTGGIHIDGFLDTCDALSSHQSKERKLEILKDSHTGAFAILCFGLYFSFYVALASNIQYNTDILVILAGGHFLQRCLSGLSVATFSCAKQSGLVYTFADAAARKTVRIVLVVLAVFMFALMLWVSLYSLLLLTVAMFVFLYYYVMSKQQFGGITGDLAGYFLQLCEIFFLAALLVGQKMEVLG